MNLKELRESKGITQIELAKQLGVVRSTVCQYEKGNREPDTITLIKLADFFDVTTDYLLGRTFTGVETNGVELPADKMEILALFDEMTPAQRARFIAYGEGLLGKMAGDHAAKKFS